MTTMRVVLGYGLIAEVVVDETERAGYVPPPVPDREHAPSCGCPNCVMRRSLDRKRGVA